MAQRFDNHPYMTRSQLDDYLASLRAEQGDMSPRHSREASYEEAERWKRTPLVRALKERYGGGNTPVPYVDVSSPKGRESPTKRSLPPIPGVKSENASGWRRHRSTPSNESQNDVPTQKRFDGQDRSPSPPAANDFWTTGVPPTIITSHARGHRPLPLDPRDPRDELRMPAIDELSLEENKPAPTINVPVINAPSDSVPSLNVPSINIPGDSEHDTEESARPEKSWPNIHVRPKGSPALFCAVCDRPIAGRIVTAIGHRFHPNCFRCHTCRTELVHYVSFLADDRNMLHSTNMMGEFIVI